MNRWFPCTANGPKNLIELADGIAQLLYKSADLPYDEAGVAKWLTDEGKEHVKVIRDQLAALPSFDKESIEHVIHRTWKASA